MEQWIGSVHSKMAWQTHFFYLPFITFWKRALHIQGWSESVTCCLLASQEKSHIRFTHTLPVHIKISLTSDATCWHFIFRTYSGRTPTHIHARMHARTHSQTHRFYPPVPPLTQGILMSHRVGIISKKQCCHLPLFLLTHSFYSQTWRSTL